MKGNPKLTALNLKWPNLIVSEQLQTCDKLISCLAASLQSFIRTDTLRKK